MVTKGGLGLRDIRGQCVVTWGARATSSGEKVLSLMPMPCPSLPPSLRLVSSSSEVWPGSKCGLRWVGYGRAAQSWQ